MLTPDLFEKMLAAYPAEQRELARQVYYRFADGDSTQFFTQLFIVLDIYAHYAERIPQTVLAANQSSIAHWQKLGEQINLLIQGLDKRNLNITNHAEKTNELCQATQAKCDETIARLEALIKNIGAQVDTKTIIQGIQTVIETGVRKEIIAPFLDQTTTLAKEVMPTLTKITEANREAARLWPKHILEVAWTSSVFCGLAIAALATLLIAANYKHYYEDKLSEKIVSAEQLINYNQAAFRQLAIAQIPVKVLRTESYGVMNPRSFVLELPGADSAEIRRVDGRDTGYIFFTSNLTEKQIQQLDRETETLTQKSYAK